MTKDREALASAVRRAQANYRAAWEWNRLTGDERTRRDLDKAKRELDDVQRVAAHAAEVLVK